MNSYVRLTRSRITRSAGRMVRKQRVFGILYRIFLAVSESLSGLCAREVSCSIPTEIIWLADEMSDPRLAGQVAGPATTAGQPMAPAHVSGIPASAQPVMMLPPQGPAGSTHTSAARSSAARHPATSSPETVSTSADRGQSIAVIASCSSTATRL